MCSSTRGPGDRALLGDVPDDERRDAEVLRERASAARCTRAPGRRCPARPRAPGRTRSGSSRRRARPGVALARPRPRPPSTSTSGSSGTRPRRRAEALGAQSRPAAATPRRTRRARSRRPSPSASAACSSSVDLPMPGSPPSSTSEPRDEPAAEHAVELGDAGRDARRPRPRPTSSSRSGATRRASSPPDAADGLLDLFDERSELAALGAATHPARRAARRTCWQRQTVRALRHAAYSPAAPPAALPPRAARAPRAASTASAAALARRVGGSRARRRRPRPCGTPVALVLDVRPRSTSPGCHLPARICSESGSSTRRWIARRSGRAPKRGSKPSLREQLARLVGERDADALRARAARAARSTMRSTICSISSLRRGRGRR